MKTLILIGDTLFLDSIESSFVSFKRNCIDITNEWNPKGMEF